MFEDAEQLIAAWNGRQARRMPMLFSSTIGAALASRHWYLWVRASPVTQHSLSTCGRLIDTQMQPWQASSPALSCRPCRPNAPFAELLRLSQTSIADEMRDEHTWRFLGE